MAARTWRGPGRQETATHELARDATLRLRSGGAPVSVRVETGCVVVTREGDAVDHVLGAGDELLLHGRGLAVAWALSAARLRLAPATTSAAAPLARRASALGGA